MITGETEQMVADHLESDAYDAFLFGRRKRGFNVGRSAERNILKSKRRRARSLRRTNRINRRIARRSTPRVMARRAKTKRFVSQVKRLAPTILPLSSNSPILNTPPYVDTTNRPTKGTTQTAIAPVPSSSAKETNMGTKIPTAVYIVGGIAVVGIIGAIVMSARNAKPNYQPI